MNNYNEYMNYLNNMSYQQENVNKPVVNNASAIKNVDDPYLGFIKGNLFKNLYDPYKNYKPVDITPSNEKNYARLLVQIYIFTLHDLSLYLDNHPDNTDIINLRMKYQNLYKEALDNYENKYGAIDLGSQTLSKSPWGWDTKYWPWEDED